MARKRKTGFNILTILILLCFILVLVYLQRYNANPITELPKPPYPFISHGIDVSHHQGDINWPKVIDSFDSINPFVYCKATEGISHVDSKFKENVEQLIELNVKHGAYHFFLPHADAIDQADHFLSEYNFQQDDLPPVLDYEIESENNDEQLDKISTWLKRVEDKTGKRPIIYTSYNIYINWLSIALPDYSFWVANYSDKVYRFKKDNILHWQYSEKGVINGIDGFVDLNYSKVKF